MAGRANQSRHSRRFLAISAPQSGTSEKEARILSQGNFPTAVRPLPAGVNRMSVIDERAINVELSFLDDLDVVPGHPNAPLD